MIWWTIYKTENKYDWALDIRGKKNNSIFVLNYLSNLHKKMEVYEISMGAFAPTPQALDPSMIIIEEKTTQMKQKKLCDD